ncbi:MAG TPA: sulfatase/phosphatase domain-containing protein, partial [Ktedonobacteraceae bacterium]
FGEGGFYFDHHGLYDAVTRIALMLRLPDQKAKRIEALVSTEDILPTLSDLVELPDTPYPLSGSSLLPLLSGSTKEIRPYVISSESTRQASLSVRTPRWRMILPIVEDIHGQPLPDFYGRPRHAEPLLFDHTMDPGEQRDLGHELPDTLAALLDTLNQWRAEMAAMTGEPDPIQCQGLTLPYTRFMERVLARF